MARFDKFDAARKRSSAQTNGHAATTKAESSTSPIPTTEVSPPPPTKHKQEDDDDDLSDVRDSPAPKQKKRKVEYDSDAAYAAKLQAQENGRIRSTRGGGPKPAAAKKKKTPKKKTSAKVKAEDDSDLDGSDETKERKVNRSGGFHVWLSFYSTAHIRDADKVLERAVAIPCTLSSAGQRDQGNHSERFHQRRIGTNMFMIAFKAPDCQANLGLCSGS